MLEHEMPWDKLGEECGVMGIYAPGRDNVPQMVCFGLVALQHRGQESAGIAVSSGGQIHYHKEMGLVQEVFNDRTLARLEGISASATCATPPRGRASSTTPSPWWCSTRGAASPWATTATSSTPESCGTAWRRRAPSSRPPSTAR